MDAHGVQFVETLLRCDGGEKEEGKYLHVISPRGGAPSVPAAGSAASSPPSSRFAGAGVETTPIQPAGRQRSSA
jgi:hypothetical protein